jgi:hypothetical protein
MRRKPPEKWRTNDWVLHHDKTRPHTAYIVLEVLLRTRWQLFPTNPSDIFLFPEMKMELIGRRFNTFQDIQVETQTVLNILTKKLFQDGFQKWQKHWDKYVRSQWDYFEGDVAE